MKQEVKLFKNQIVKQAYVLQCKRWLLLLGAWCLTNAIQAQDLRFSQFFHSPLTTNPANTGFIPDADYRLIANYRNQWSSILTNPYKTMSISGDTKLLADRFESGWLGIGGVILRDVAGAGNLTSTKVYGSVAYHQMLGYSSLLSAGFNLGWANKRIDISKLTFPDQFNGKFFDKSYSTDAYNYISKNNVSYFDMQAGLNYAYFPTDKVYINAGFSVHHINRPEETFFQPQVGIDTRIPRRYIGFLNASIKLNELVIINPNIYYSLQAKANEIVAGGYIQYNLSGDGETQLLGGAYFRVGDAAIPLVGFQWKDFRLAFTYDATVSSLATYNGSRGAYEIGIVKQGLLNSHNKGGRQVLCPTFKN